MRVSIKCVRINGGSWNNRNIVFNVDIQKTGPPHPHYLLGGGPSARIARFGTPGGGDSGGNIIKQLLSNKRKSQLMKALTVDESHN